ncbi:MAG TPA: hypothetical protein VIJ51_15955 [Solirubrobacteraceae bacterium]
MGGSWVKQGVLVAPPLAVAWSATHVALPYVDPGAEVLYCSTRDCAGRSWIARARLDLASEAVGFGQVDPEPVLRPGALGCFDDSGVTMSCVVDRGDEKYLYYTGWSLGVTVPFYLAIGLAISRGGGPFERVSQAPVLGRTASDPYLTASPHILVEDGRWRMWYVSCVGWTRREDGVRHHYHLRYAESADGIDWETGGRVAIDFADEREYAIARPCVVRGNAGYEMWFSARGDAYRLGYARSTDGLDWTRLDEEGGLDVSPGEWDGEMIAYPHVFDHDGRRFMLYNGNNYGATGVGSAVVVG